MRNYKSGYAKYENLLWNDRGCHGKTRYLCEFRPGQPDNCYENSDTNANPPTPTDLYNDTAQETELNKDPIRIGQTRYFIVGAQKTWAEAQKHCKDYKLIGAAITDEAYQRELEYTVTMMMINKKYVKYIHDGRRFWTAGHFVERDKNRGSYKGKANEYKGYDKKFEWDSLDRAVGNFTKWYDNTANLEGDKEPRDDAYTGLENCMDVHILKKDGAAQLSWFAGPCQLPASFLCMERSPCAPGIEISSQKFQYSFCKDKRQYFAMGDPNKKETWRDAVTKCRDLGMQLATPGSYEQTKAMADEISKNIVHSNRGLMWISTIGGPNSEFAYISGGADAGCATWVLGQLPWDANEPNTTIQNKGFACVAFDWKEKGSNGKWSVGNCDEDKNFYLCEEACTRSNSKCL